MTQHRQLGTLSLGRSAAAGVSVRHSTTQYWQSESPPRGCRAAAAIGEPQAQAAKQVKVNLNSGLLRKFKFKFACKLIPINSSFNALSHISKLKFKESQGFTVKILPLHMDSEVSTGRRAAAARASRMISDWLQA